MTRPAEPSPAAVSLSPASDREVAGGRTGDHREWGGFYEARHLPAICNATAALYKESFGRGPMKVCAHFAGPDVVVVVLEDTLTIAERNLFALGQHERLQQTRFIAHRALEHEMRSIAERILGRRAVASMSTIDVRRDVAAELLMLEPESVTASADRGPASSDRFLAATQTTDVSV